MRMKALQAELWGYCWALCIFGAVSQRGHSGWWPGVGAAALGCAPRTALPLVPLFQQGARACQQAASIWGLGAL